MKFADLDLHPTVMAGLERLQFTECTPIQEAAMPHILLGKDLAGLAQTGTGKTAAYLVPLMDRILHAQEPEGSLPIERLARAFTNWKPTNYVLVLVPTRELAEQVFENINSIGQNAGLKGVAVYGGMSYDPQKRALSQGVQFIVATPGRLIDLFKEHVVDLSQARAVVFDEADRMFDMGFKDDMKYILRRIPRDRQFLVFSATLNFDVLNVAYEFGAEPVEVNVSRDQAKAENVDDELFHVGSAEKPAYLLSILKKLEPKQAIIFSNFKNNVERIAHFLSQNGVPAMGISSLLSQAQRNRVMSQFRAENDRNILVATDVAARGLDIKGVDLVVNYELPDDPENYVHRIGRTGRAGARGKAFSLVSDRDVDALARIEDYLGHKVKTGWLEDSEIAKDFKPFVENAGRPSKGDRPMSRQTRGNEGSEGRRPGPGRDGGRRGQGQGRGRDRGRDRDRDRDRDRRDRRSSGGRDGQQQQQQQQRQPQEGVHRDRLMGRHGSAQSGTGSEKRGDQQQRSNGPSSSHNQRRRDFKGRRHQQQNQQRGGGQHAGQRGGGRYRGGRYRVEESASRQNKSLGQKISGFFKNLFGR